MKPLSTGPVVALLGAFLAAPVLGAGEPQLPVVGGEEVLATVNGESVTLDRFYRELASVHESAAASGTPIHRQNTAELLERLITVRLVVQEAKNIGLDGLPEVTGVLETFRRDTLRNLLFAREVKNVDRPDPAEVERLYRLAVKEYRITSVLFDKEEDAKALDAKVHGGASYDDLAARAVASGKATGGQAPQFVKGVDLESDVAAALSKLEPGRATPVLKIGRKYTVVKLIEVRYPEDSQAREQAVKDALQIKRSGAVHAYADGLRARYATVNKKLLDSLDFEAKEPGFKKLREDRRVLAEVAGEDPVRVEDLAAALERLFFHGIEEAIERRRINAKKSEALDDLLAKRVVVKEAKRLKLDQTAEYRAQVEDYADGVLFGTFVKKVVDPGIKLDDAELRNHLARHPDDYLSPGTIRIDSLAFVRKEDAEVAVAKLRQGTDLQWLRTNAEGQADPENVPDALEFHGKTVATRLLPDAVQKSVAGARAGDVRLFAPEGGPAIVLVVLDVVPPKPQPLEAVRDEVAAAVSREKRKAAIDEWAAKLRSASDVKTFATREQLDRIVQREMPKPAS